MLSNVHAILAYALTLVGAPAITTLLVRFFGAKAPKAIETGIKVAEVVAEDGVKLIGDLHKIPEFAALHGKLQTAQNAADEAAAKLRQSELYRVATVVLHAFGQHLTLLSDDQKKAAAFYIASRVPGVTPQEVADALAFVQKEADDASASSLITAANAFTEAQRPVLAQPDTTSAQAAPSPAEQSATVSA